MGVKRFFDGQKLIETEVPDAPLPDVLNVRGTSALDVLNPGDVDPNTLPVDAAQLDNLRPTAGAIPLTKFPEPLPGTGEGAGVGQPSGATLRDAWANNPNRDPGTVESVQSGPVGSALAPPVAEAAAVTNRRLAEAAGKPSVDGFEELTNGFKNKDAIREYIVANGGEEPHASATRDELIDAARDVYRAQDTKLAADLA